MEIKYYLVNASLSKCESEDFRKMDGSFLENRFFFTKDIVTREFKNTYRLRGVNAKVHRDEHQDALEKYTETQIDFLVSLDLVYKLNNTYNQDDYCFKMYLKTAIDFDVFNSPSDLLIGAIFYQLNEEKQVNGPYYIDDNTPMDSMTENIKKGIVLVPHKKQTFERVLIAKAS